MWSSMNTRHVGVSECQLHKIFRSKHQPLPACHTPWFVFTPHCSCFVLIQIRKGGGVRPNIIWITRSLIPAGRHNSLGSQKLVCSGIFFEPSASGIAGWNMEYEWVPPPIRASIRDHLRGSGPLLRGCRGAKLLRLKSEVVVRTHIRGIASPYHYDQCASKIWTADNNWLLSNKKIFQ